MKSQQLKNLITLMVMFSSDDNISSDISYIVEKYDRFFKTEPKINCLSLYKHICETDSYFCEFISENMQKWKIKETDNHFNKYFTILYFVYNHNFEQIINNGLKHIIKSYNLFFKEDDLYSSNLDYTIHAISQRFVINIVNDNSRLFKLMKLLET